MPQKNWLLTEAERYEGLSREADQQSLGGRLKMPASYYRDVATSMRDQGSRVVLLTQETDLQAFADYIEVRSGSSTDRSDARVFLDYLLSHPAGYEGRDANAIHGAEWKRLHDDCFPLNEEA